MHRSDWIGAQKIRWQKDAEEHFIFLPSIILPIFSSPLLALPPPHRRARRGLELRIQNITLNHENRKEHWGIIIIISGIPSGCYCFTWHYLA
jgi:hypothetical protein